jgi:hypothetical protein
MYRSSTGYKGSLIVERYNGYTSSVVVQGYRCCTEIVQGYRCSTVVLW